MAYLLLRTLIKQDGLVLEVGGKELCIFFKTKNTKETISTNEPRQENGFERSPQDRNTSVVTNLGNNCHLIAKHERL